MGVPLARRNLTTDKRRFLLLVAGVSFAVILMFVELGFYFALFDSSLALVRCLDCDLVMRSTTRYATFVADPFPRRRLFEARDVPEVAQVVPLYIETQLSTWKNPKDCINRPIRVLAFDPADQALLLQDVIAQVSRLQPLGTVLFDVKSKRFYGPRAENLHTELGQHDVRIVGLFQLGTDFTSDGTVIMSDHTFARLFPQRTAGPPVLTHVDLGLIRLTPGADKDKVCADLKKQLPPDVKVFTRDEYEAAEKRFWNKSSPIAAIFFVGAGLGFLVGVVICSQILYTEVADHIPEYATLKAIGYSDRFLTGVILKESLWLSVFGYLAGIVCSGFLYGGLGNLTGLPMKLTAGRAAVILGLTVVMCFIAGFVALLKVKKADPAEVF